MKKLVFAVALMLASAGIVSAACSGPYCYDDTGATVTAATAFTGYVRLPTYTVAQINALPGPTTGAALIECFNCTAAAMNICKSSGTANGSWVILASTGGIMNNLHCQ
jgi:hypothetical protein